MPDLLSLLTIGPIWGGIIAGILHAILGPDHLSTIATLSVCQGAEAFWFGVRWASGHVSGMLTIGIVLSLLSWKYSDVFETYEHYADYFIGFLLMMFGGYFLFQKDRSFDAERNLKSGSCGCCHQAGDDAAETEAGSSERSPLYFKPRNNNNNNIRGTSSSIMGFVQGMACPAGLVGIVFLKQYVQSLPRTLLFMAVFFVITALSMGCMAMAYGVLTKRCISSATLAYCIYCASCLVSLVLGATWIILAASGRLALLGHDHHHHHHEHGLPHDESLLFILAAPR